MPCPECYKDANRIMPTSFAAFTFRDGYPRRIPDDGKFYHLGKKVSTRVKSGRPNEHPEVNKPKPKPKMTRGERSALNDMREAALKGELSDSMGNAIKPQEVKQKLERGDVIRKSTPKRGLPNR
jgi:hypothetical protein